MHAYEGSYAEYLEKRELEREIERGEAEQKVDEALEHSVDEILAFQHDLVNDKPTSEQWRKRLGELEPLLDTKEAQAEELQMQIEDAKMIGSTVLAEELAAELAQLEIELGQLSAEWDALMDD